MVSVGNIEVGDELSLSAGMVVPVDGTVLEGRTDVEQSVITGEEYASSSKGWGPCLGWKYSS